MAYVPMADAILEHVEQQDIIWYIIFSNNYEC